MKLRNLISTILLMLAAVGICSADAYAEVNRRKFGGKELMSDHGYNSYDFAARHQNPAFPHFTTPDQMAETKPWNSGYLYCGGDPINFIDPTGLHEYIFTTNGWLLDIIENEDYDQITIQNYNNEIVAQSNKFTYGTIQAEFVTSKDDDGNERQYDYLVFQNTPEAKEVFEFFSNNTNVEWTLGGIIVNNNTSLNVITTSHQNNHESAFNYFLFDNQKGRNIEFINAITLHIHNHPSGIPIPSGIDSKKGDIPNAKMLTDANHQAPIQFKVYSAKYDMYVPYTPNSKHTDFFLYKLYMRWIDFLNLLYQD